MFRSGAFLILVEPVPVKSATPLTFTVPPSSVNLPPAVTLLSVLMLPPRLTFPVVVIAPVARALPPVPTVKLPTASAAVFNRPPVTLTIEIVGTESTFVVPPVTFRVPMAPVPFRVVEAELLSVVTFSAPPESSVPLPETFAIGAVIEPPATELAVPPEMSICASPARTPVPLTARVPPVMETDRLFSLPAVTFSAPPPVTVVARITSRLLLTLTMPVPLTVSPVAPSRPTRAATTLTSPLGTIILFNWPGPVGPGFQWFELQVSVAPSQVLSEVVNRNARPVSVLCQKFTLFQAGAAPVSTIPLSSIARPVTAVSPSVRSPA